MYAYNGIICYVLSKVTDHKMINTKFVYKETIQGEYHIHSHLKLTMYVRWQLQAYIFNIPLDFKVVLSTGCLQFKRQLPLSENTNWPLYIRLSHYMYTFRYTRIVKYIYEYTFFFNTLYYNKAKTKTLNIWKTLSQFLTGFKVE